MKKVIFDGKEMEVLDYDEELGTVEVPVVLSGLSGNYCPLDSQLGPIVSIMQGDLIVMCDDVDATGILHWAGGALFVYAVFYLICVVFGGDKW